MVGRDDGELCTAALGGGRVGDTCKRVCRHCVPRMSTVLVFLLIGAKKLALVGDVTKPVVVVANAVRESFGALAAWPWFPRVRKDRPWLWLVVKSLRQFGHLEDQA